MTPRITLLTDFGTRDGYVGVMKGVMVGIAPGILLDDVSHDVDPGDAGGASRALGRYWREWPTGTVHLVVVDPGVGTSRRALGVEAEGRFLVGPDNGVLTPVFLGGGPWRAVELSDPAYRWSPSPSRPGAREPRAAARQDGAPGPAQGPPSRTFHGRDVFAPAAAHLASGVPLEALGATVEDPVLLPEPGPVQASWGWEGMVLAADRFGNLLTNLPGELLSGAREVEVGEWRVPVGGTYGDVPAGTLLALVNSDGRVEVAMRNGSALQELGAEPGTVVKLLQEEA